MVRIEPWDTCGSCRNILRQGLWSEDRESCEWINTLDGIGRIVQGQSERKNKWIEVE